jgi:hypothetical protein
MPGTLMIDSIHANVGNIPARTPRVAGYVTGTPDIQWTAHDWARFPRSGKAPIDQSPELAAYASSDAMIADIEPQAGTVPAYVEACRQRLHARQPLCFYCSQSTVAEVSAALVNAEIPLGNCWVWIANWNLSQAEADALLGTTVSGVKVLAVQWASPTSNPRTLVPGSTLTLAEANVDLSVTRPTWFGPA